MQDMTGQELSKGCKVAWGSRHGSCYAKTNIGEVLQDSICYKDGVLVKNLKTNKVTERKANQLVRYGD